MTFFDDVAEPDLASLRAEEEANLEPTPHRALVVSIRDRSNKNSKLLAELLHEGGFHVGGLIEVESKRSAIRQAIETAVVGGVDLVLTVGGVGVGPRDKTPEATQPLLDMEIPGIAQAIRASGIACGALDAATSRGISGVSGSTLIVNLAASRSAIRDGVATLLPLSHHVVGQLQGSSDGN